MSEKPASWRAIDSLIWPHIAANLIREQHANIERMKDENERLREALEIIAGHRQCVDPLMGNQDVAIAALAQK